MNAPCKRCKNKGCGSYHDKCAAFKDFKDGVATAGEIKRRQNNVIDAHYKGIERTKNSRRINEEMKKYHKGRNQK